MSVVDDLIHFFVFFLGDEINYLQTTAEEKFYGPLIMFGQTPMEVKNVFHIIYVHNTMCIQNSAMHLHRWKEKNKKNQQRTDTRKGKSGNCFRYCRNYRISSKDVIMSLLTWSNKYVPSMILDKTITKGYSAQLIYRQASFVSAIYFAFLFLLTLLLKKTNNSSR